MLTFTSLIEQIETELAQFYNFQLEISVTQCLLPAEKAGEHITHNNRAATLVCLNPETQDLELGVYIEPELVHILQTSNPMVKLNQQNLDAFCVLVEELSHFHLIAYRAMRSQFVSRLELEWQGEIDKVLLAGSFLLRQTGQTYFWQLAHLIFDRASSYTSDAALYEEAVHYAARSWYRLLPQLKVLGAREQWLMAQQEFRRTYRLHWSAKVQAIANF